MANMVSSDNGTIIETFAKVFQNKDKQDDVNDTINEEYLQEIVGRVTEGSEEAHFQYLDKDVGAKQFPWVMGADGLILFLKKIKLSSATFNWF